jgi:Nucleotidyltransferase domain
MGWPLPAEQNARRFLARFGVAPEELEGFVRGLSRDETLLLGGSVADGLANRDSDIDLMLLGGLSGGRSVVFLEAECEISTERHPSGLELSVEAWDGSYLERLARRVAVNSAGLTSRRGLDRLDLLREGDLRLLHRLRTGLALVNAAAADAWRERLAVSTLDAYLVLHFLQQHFVAREDAIAEWHEGYRDSAGWMFRTALGHLAGACLASIGETNAAPKWRLRLLDRHIESLDEKIVGELKRLLGASLQDEAGLRAALALSDGVIARVFSRRPDVVPAVLGLLKRLPFTTAMD